MSIAVSDEWVQVEKDWNKFMEWYEEEIIPAYLDSFIDYIDNKCTDEPQEAAP